MNVKSFQDQLRQVWKSTLRLRILLFLALLTILYAFIAWRINTLVNAEPDAAAIEAKMHKTATPTVDKSIVDKIRQLEDNSVDVRTLFNEARQNPFRE
ncbi:MAG TPA: hypothetical protein VF733_06205 [Candidatus Saccharimonadales bacterium]